MRVTISPEALEDLRSIGAWIARDRPARAVTFLTELKRCFALLASTPLIGRRREELGTDLRSFPHGNHVIFYRPTSGEVEIVRVLHGHRDLSRGLPRD